MLSIAAAKRPHLADHEHILRCETAPGGAELVATTFACYRRNTRTGEHAWERTDWADVAAVRYDRRQHVLLLHRWPHLPGPDRLLALGPHSRLPEVAAERAGACRVVDLHEQITSSCHIEIIAVRNPADGAVRWMTEVSGGCDPADAELARTIDRTVHLVRSQTGV